MPEPVPADVHITPTARAPVTDPALGLDVTLEPSNPAPAPTHRLVAIGDSLLQGFQSGAIYHTDLSVPAIIAYELVCPDHFRHPVGNGWTNWRITGSAGRDRSCRR